jgi:o-succinylbenzoate synthase
MSLQEVTLMAEVLWPCTSDKTHCGWVVYTVKQLSLIAATVQSASFRRYSLPLRQAVTTTAGAAAARRDGFLLRLRSVCGATGLGEVAPLPGLHAESLTDAEQQLTLLCHRLVGTPVPTEVAFTGGSIRSWLWTHLGFTDSALLPSVRCGLEFAVLNLVAATRGVSLCTLLQGAPRCTRAGCGGMTTLAGGVPTPSSVRVNGLLANHATPEAAAAAAAKLVDAGFDAIKIKVARAPATPEDDARTVLAVRRAVGHAVTLRADANRGWQLDQAVRFGHACAGAALQYLEEPTADPLQATEFFRRTQVRHAQQLLRLARALISIPLGGSFHRVVGALCLSIRDVNRSARGIFVFGLPAWKQGGRGFVVREGYLSRTTIRCRVSCHVRAVVLGA